MRTTSAKAKIFFVMLSFAIAFSCGKNDPETDSSTQENGSNYSCAFAQSQYDIGKRSITSMEKLKATSTSSAVIQGANTNISNWKKTMANIESEAKKHGCTIKH